MIFPQDTVSSVKYVEKQRVFVDKYCNNLKNNPKYDRVLQICQNELTNHTHVTVLVRMVFVRAFRPRQVALYSSDDALKGAQK